MTNLPQDIKQLQHFFEAHEKVVVLTGAGISAPSGIPTYRDGAGNWLHSAPIKHQQFLQDANCRQRYWARSLMGWPAVRDARPNQAHRALAALEAGGRVDLVITQNVDRLHQRAGSHNVVDLHGRLDHVRCLACDAVHAREHVQGLLSRANASWQTRGSRSRPDGDAEVADDWVRQLQVPHCTHCEGVLMPDVVFFGGSVPAERVQACVEALSQADALLAIGSSLQVYSGFRFCRHAQRLGKEIALINPGVTRADEMAGLKLKADCAPLLHGVLNHQADGGKISPIRSR